MEDVVERTTLIGEDAAQLVQHIGGLDAHVPFAYDLPVLIERDLAGDEEQVARAGGVRVVAVGRRDGTGVDLLDSGDARVSGVVEERGQVGVAQAVGDGGAQAVVGGCGQGLRRVGGQLQVLGRVPQRETGFRRA